MKQKNKGFSLLELIVSIAIMAVLSGMLAPQFFQYIERARETRDMQTLQVVYTAVQAALSDEEAYEDLCESADAETAKEAEVRVYSSLFLDADPESGDRDFLEVLNHDSLEVLTDCKVEASILPADAPAAFQFLRLGYFCIDNVDSTAEHPVFNRSVSLKDSFNKK